MYVVSKSKRVNTFSPDLFGRFFIFDAIYDSVGGYYYFFPMSDTPIKNTPEDNFLSGEEEMLELTAGDEHLMISAGEEEKLLTSGEQLAEVLPEVQMASTSPIATPEEVPVALVEVESASVSEDLFADLPISSREYSCPRASSSRIFSCGRATFVRADCISSSMYEQCR